MKTIKEYTDVFMHKENRKWKWNDLPLYLYVGHKTQYSRFRDESPTESYTNQLGHPQSVAAAQDGNGVQLVGKKTNMSTQ